jgi:hypothetical protein
MQGYFRIKTPYSPPVAGALRQSKIKHSKLKIPIPPPFAALPRTLVGAGNAGREYLFLNQKLKIKHPKSPSPLPPYFEILNQPDHISFLFL